MLESGVEGRTVLDDPLSARLEAKALDCGIWIEIVIFFFSYYGGLLDVDDDLGGSSRQVSFSGRVRDRKKESAFFSQVLG